MMTPVGDGDVADGRSGQPPIEGALGELIEVEERIEAEVADAEAEAERLVEAARRDARAVEQDGSTPLEEALGTLRASIEKECAVSVRALAEHAEAEVERYRRVDEATLCRLAQWVASRVARGSKAS
jgi:vacuolar-type H+-ATPase subunit H